MSEREEKLILAKIEAMRLLVEELRLSRDQRVIELKWFQDHVKLATKHDLEQMEKRIMAGSEQVKQQLQEAIASAKQTNLDIVEVQRIVTEQSKKITELEEAVKNGEVSPEIAELVTQVRDLNKQADDGLPNPVVVPPNP